MDAPAGAAASAGGGSALPLPRGTKTRVLGVFAHPDDESFVAAATVAAYVSEGCDVRLAVLTAGEAGVAGVERAGEAADDRDPARIGDLARSGLARYGRACAALGVRECTSLEPGRWRDLGTTSRAGSLAAADLAEVARCVRLTLAERPVDVLITVDEDGVTGHPDHVRTHAAVVHAVDELARQGAPVPLTLGGCVRSVDVTAAVGLLRDLAPQCRPGSGIRGVGEVSNLSGVSGLLALRLLALRLPPEAMRSRRAALDVYADGLGSRPLEDLVEGLTYVGDGVLLRTIAEVAGFDREFFRILRPGGAVPVPTG
ncbi:MAG TPA: PIG-L family deacetylase [Actinopolymorphaceae bacterium]|nr:PIG-L family deacetylase [Actinopolymorphaceae bacterium]